MTPLFPPRFLPVFPLRAVCFLFPRVVVSTGNGGNKQGEPRASIEGKWFPPQETTRAVVSYRTTRVSWLFPECVS